MNNPADTLAAEWAQDGMAELDRDALETVLAMAQAWSKYYATELRPQIFNMMPNPHSDHERAIRRVSALLAPHPTPSPAPQGGGEAPFCWIRFLNGAPDWAEDCLSLQDVLEDYASEDGYSMEPLYLRATPPAQQPGEVGEDAIFAAARKYSTTGQDARMRQTFEFDDHGLREFVAALAPKEKG